MKQPAGEFSSTLSRVFSSYLWYGRVRGGEAGGREWEREREGLGEWERGRESGRDRRHVCFVWPRQRDVYLAIFPALTTEPGEYQGSLDQRTLPTVPRHRWGIESWVKVAESGEKRVHISGGC